MRFNFFASKTLLPSDAMQSTAGVGSGVGGDSTTEPLTVKPRLRHQMTVDEDPDSLDSVISNPHSYPITIVPNRPASLYGLSPNPKAYNRQLSYKARNFRPGLAAKLVRRAVLKSGDRNVRFKNVKNHRVRFIQDIYTTLVDSQWRWTILVFVLSFVLSWLFFAVLWWLILFSHGDFDPTQKHAENWQPCVTEINGFTSCFLFSIETQHTIGYGSRATTEECPEGVFLMCVQSIYGVISSAFMAGIMFAKMTRSKQRAQTLLFSNVGVICQRKGCLSLMFRVGDMQKSLIIGASVRALLVRGRVTAANGAVKYDFTELEVNVDECGPSPFLIWPMVVEHRLVETSPLYEMSAADLLRQRFEIVLLLEGTVESTGQSAQARSSYTSAEVIWGHRFDSIVSYNRELHIYEVDYSRFDATIEVETPLCSARELHEYYKKHGCPSEASSDQQSSTPSRSLGAV